MSQQINLFNPVFMRQRKYFSLIAMLQGLVLIALGSGLFYGYAVYHVKALTIQSAEAKKHFLVEQEKLQRYKTEFSPEESSRILSGELKSVEAKLAAQRELLQTLKSGAIGNTTGYSSYMRAFARQAVNGLWLNGFDITGDASRISLSGAVLSPDLLPAYIRGLSQEPVMQGKSFASLQMKRREDEGKAVEFTLQSVEAGGTEKQ